MREDTLRIILTAALLPVAAFAIRLFADLIVWLFPSLKRFHDKNH